MEDRVALHYIYVSLISACLAILLASLAFFSSYVSQLQDALDNQVAAIAMVYDRFAGDGDWSTLQTWSTELQVYAADGTLIFSTDSESAIPYGALNAETGSGRYAEDGERILYSALLLADGTLLCLSRTMPDLIEMYSHSLGYILLLFLLLIPLSILSSLLLTRRLLRPLKELTVQLSAPHFDPSGIKIYPEFQPLVQEINERRNEREAMRQEFTANVSHELKTPLTTISGYSEIIAGGLAKPEDIPRFAQQIHRESERMQQLVGDIIELNALDSEVIHQHDDNVNLLALVQDCIEQLSAQFALRRLSVYVTGDGFTVQGNRRQLWELVYNLLDNARRYNVDGGMIHVTTKDGVLSVRDTGIGIPKSHQSRVFERFYRVDKSHSRATGGTGLGLSIVKHVAELHGATPELESEEHIGTEIRIRFREYT